MHSTHTRSGRLLALAVVGLLAAVAAWSTAAPNLLAAEDEPVQIMAFVCSEHPEFHYVSSQPCVKCEGEVERMTLPFRGADQTSEPYPLDTCVISGLKLGSKGDPIVMMHEGREVRFCCKGCIGPFVNDSAKHLAALDKTIIAQQKESYPLTECVVSAEPLDVMGAPVNVVYNNRLVRFCCNGCVKMFKKDPVAYLAELDQAIIEAQIDDYPLTTCLVAEGKLGSMGDPVDIVIANQLTRYCCGGCATAVWKEPTTYLAKVSDARKLRESKRKPADTAPATDGDE